MSDVFSTEKRSQIMSRVKGAGNKATEEKIITLMRKYKISGWRRGSRMIGKPDFVFSRYKLALFVDGCFWHRCPTHGSIPVQNRAFWEKKLTRNVERDSEVRMILKRRGWIVLRVWQHELKRHDLVARRIRNAIARTENSKHAHE